MEYQSNLSRREFLSGLALTGLAAIATSSCGKSYDPRLNDRKQLQVITPDMNQKVLGSEGVVLVEFTLPNCHYNDVVNPLYAKVSQDYDPRDIWFTRSDINGNPDLAKVLDVGVGPRIAIVKAGKPLYVVTGSDFMAGGVEYNKPAPQDKQESAFRKTLEQNMKKHIK